MQERYHDLISAMAKTYNRMLKEFRPCKPGSEFLEQNLITLLAHEFLCQYPNGIAYTEIPFTPPEDDSWKSRLDAYMATSEFGLLVEAKGSKSRVELFKSIEEDLTRIYSPKLKSSFAEMAIGNCKKSKLNRSYILPKSMHGLIVADCWSEDTAKAWEENPYFNNPCFNLITKALPMGEYGGYKYFILYAITEQLDW
ncbi:hypothetical protein A3740_15800 [Oleiphilus sp. HI0068]|uniref:hypothetical protein n=1 Tax=Oleiphilus sp. HI0132 TaxID=1822270 RepID=UPI0007C26321|nr:hypothetical protein [Oleiphilus sp. HI0132]KZY75188.1 hypothetical protein A3740_15800 [Oleiphilus sp. HI0068]KZY81133.1 hypothetical protein A3741_17745 [Oleiphilus sp. HI0069]KZZ75435.1 hypothetical protein A3766_16710 [Oleiphilus sp. HI0132]